MLSGEWERVQAAFYIANIARLRMQCIRSLA